MRGAHADVLVTGEAVRIDVPPAALPLRMLAKLIDLAIYLTGFMLVLIAIATQVREASEASVSTLVLLDLVAALVIVPVVVETLSRGRSVGKLALRLRVVRDDGGPIVFRHAFVRGLIGFVEFFVAQGFPAVISAAASSRGKRLGDFAAGTYVVREDTRMHLTPPPPVPRRLSAWAANADISALPDGVALAVRQYLLRPHSLTPGAHARMRAGLVAAVAPCVSPAPPPGTPDDELLAAVLAERRRRDALRLQRDEMLRQRLVPPDELVSGWGTPV